MSNNNKMQKKYTFCIVDDKNGLNLSFMNENGGHISVEKDICIM